VLTVQRHHHPKKLFSAAPSWRGLSFAHPQWKACVGHPFINTAFAEERNTLKTRFTVHIEVDVHDSKQLYQAALKTLTEGDGLDAESAKSLIGLDEANAHVTECLIAILDPGTPPAGTSITGTTVEFHAA
jgi:hypothetical protein